MIRVLEKVDLNLESFEKAVLNDLTDQEPAMNVEKVIFKNVYKGHNDNIYADVIYKTIPESACIYGYMYSVYTRNLCRSKVFVDSDMLQVLKSL